MIVWARKLSTVFAKPKKVLGLPHFEDLSSRKILFLATHGMCLLRKPVILFCGMICGLLPACLKNAEGRQLTLFALDMYLTQKLVKTFFFFYFYFFNVESSSPLLPLHPCNSTQIGLNPLTETFQSCISTSNFSNNC